MDWIDAENRRWTLTADRDAVTLRSGDDELHLRRDDWPQDLYATRAQGQVVIRFSGPEHDVGFLVTPDQASALFTRLDYDALAITEAIAQAAAADPSVRRREGPMWPTITHISVWALICSALAFIPVVGLAFALASLILILVHRHRSQSTAATSHARVMIRVAFILTVGGVAVSLLSMYSFVHAGARNLDSVGLRLFGEPIEYSYGAIAASIIIVILSLSIHECGHAIVAWWCGDDYAKSLGRVTLNPLAHIDLFGTVVLPVLLTVANAPVFGYAKPVPVQLGNVRRFRRAHILISLAGPGANLLLAALSLMLHLGVGCLLVLFAPDAQVREFSSIQPLVEITGVSGGTALAGLALILKQSFLINIFLAFFNLIPIPPLDGSWVLEHLFPRTLGRMFARVRPYGFLLFLALLWTGALEILLVPAFIVELLGQLTVALCTGL